MKPNILFIMCDELRAFELGCYGHPAIRTPHIDALAEQGVRFDVGVSSAPVCQPARAVVLSGQYARTCRGGVNNEAWLPKQGGWIMPQWPRRGRPELPDPTLPELLRGHGYHTSAIGKWHAACWPDDIGFDDYLIPATQHAHSAQWFTQNGGPVFTPPGFSVDYEADRVCDFLERRRDADEPWFLYYNLSPPHMPLADAPQRYLEMYRDDDAVIRGNVDLDTPLENQTSKFLTYLWDYRYYRDGLPYASTLPDGFDLRRLHAMYMGLTTWVDDKVGQVIAALDRLGLRDDTVVVFTSDHGDNLGSHALLGKSQLIEESIRIPFVVRGPNIPAGRVATQVASLVDVGTTLLSLAGAPPARHLQGQNLVPVLRGERATLDCNMAFIESSEGCGVRTPTQLLGVPWAEDRRSLADRPHRFHDLPQDPWQLDNQVGSAAWARPVRELEAQLRQWDQRTPWRPPVELPPASAGSA
ncbi:MAG: sulfatase-like hydrolase/transferase [Phycisphaeraceae bacterium]